jgi:hypothetical protein
MNNKRRGGENNEIKKEEVKYEEGTFMFIYSLFNDAVSSSDYACRVEW